MHNGFVFEGKWLSFIFSCVNKIRINHHFYGKKKYLPNLIGEKVEIEDIIFSANV